MSEKRSHVRHDFRAHAMLNSGSKLYPAHLLNVSYTGALIAILEEYKLNAGDEVELTIEDDDIGKIRMKGKAAHQKNHYLGLYCRPLEEQDTRNLAELLIKTKHRD